MQNNYTPSVNIIRDAERNLNYRPTPNAQRAVDKIVNEFRLGKRSFNIIGSYGTGKSSFLWALQQSIKVKKPFFEIKYFQEATSEIINIIGEYKSFAEVLADYFHVVGNNEDYKNIFAEIFQRYHDIGKEQPLLILIVDEFGKFLEFAAKNSPEKELYFFQQFAEFINNPDHNILLLTTVHQNFDAYAFNLSDAQRQEWTKVKGRFEEITFNEPVEQLIFLASEQLSELSDFKTDKAKISAANDVFLNSNAFKISKEFKTSISKKIYPLDMLSAYVLTLALQKYGQNERSLFSFLSTEDYSGIRGYDKNSNPFYNLSNVFDYLSFNFYSFLTSTSNTDFSAWTNIKDAIEKLELYFEGEELEYAEKILKSLGLLNIFASKGAKLGHDFVLEYAKICLGFEASSILAKLEEKKVIFYRNYINRFIIFEGTDIDLPTVMNAAANLVGEITDISTLLNRYFELSPVFAKEYYYKTGTPRIFEFIISQEPKENLTPKDEVDGYINLIFNDKRNLTQLQEISRRQQGAIIYGYYNNPKLIKELVFEIEKVKKAIEIVPIDDKVAHKELREILKNREDLLNEYIVQNLFTSEANVIWLYKDDLLEFHSKRKFNQQLTIICNEIYNDSPEYRNELVNRTKLSSAIFTAKKLYIQNLVRKWNEYDLGYPTDRFPAEKTIYITLLKENGLIPSTYNPSQLIELNSNSTFKALWAYCDDFLIRSKKNRLRISELSEALQKQPFKLKQGLLEFWLPSYLFIKRNDFALFHQGVYLPVLNDEILELINKRPQEYEVKAFDIEGVRLDIFNSYRALLQQNIIEDANNMAFIETLKPFFTFYKELPDYSKNTKRLSKEALALREAIVKSKDPEKTFFEDFPQALGYTVSDLQNSKEALEEYVFALQVAIKELRTSYQELVNRIEIFICNELIYEQLSFEKYKIKLQQRFVNLKKHLLIPTQKTFVLRLDSQIDDREAWLNSLAQALLGKALNYIKDEEELILYDKFKNMILELDNLTNLSEENHDEVVEEVVRLEINTFGNNTKKTVKIPKQKADEIKALELAIKKQLGKDKTLNIAALTNVLKILIEK